MEIIFNEKTKEALNNLISNSNDNYVRIKVFYGCGRPAYEIYSNFKSDDDIEEVVDGIKFIVDKKDVRACSKLEIKYDKEIYNKGFYIKDID